MIQRIEVTKKDGSTITSGAMNEQCIEVVKEAFLAKYKGCQYKIYEV